MRKELTKGEQFWFWGASVWAFTGIMYQAAPVSIALGLIMYCLWVIGSLAVGYYAYRKGQRWLYWFVLAMVLNPIWTPFI
jgi:hypothetical protein